MKIVGMKERKIESKKNKEYEILSIELSLIMLVYAM